MTIMSSWARRVRAEDAGSLAVALMLTLVGVSLSSLLVPVVIGQLHTSSETIRRDRALNAAQSGIEIAMAKIRAASTAGNATNPLLGVRTALPCGSFTGVIGAGGTSSYSVSISYRLTDPVVKPLDPAIKCVSGAGPQTVPLFALLTAVGSDDTGGTAGSVTRQLTATYVFTTTNANISGGLIHVFKTATSRDLCLDAGATSPAVGANVVMQPCDPSSNSQKFAYNTNLTLSLVASRSGGGLGMCLDAGSPHAVGNYVQFQQCATTTQPRQQWSINDNANFEGTTDGKTLDHYCFNVQTPNTAGSFVVLGKDTNNTCRKGYDNIETWQPEASTGAGAAGPAIGELIDFNQFGRCLDVTEGNVNYGYLIAWPCKQAPDPSNVAWNQKWIVPAALPHDGFTNFWGVGGITTNPTSGLYCLQSPRSTAAGKYVTVVLCKTQLTDAQKWTVWAASSSFANSFTVQDVDGNCMQPTDPTDKPPDFYPQGQNISKIVVRVCNGSTLQKWNAPPTVLADIPLKDIGEK
jgi:hypothetical protein